MTSPLVDIEAFLKETPPFDLLEPMLQRRAAASIEACYRRKGSVILEIGDRNDHLWLVRRGAVEAHDRAGTLVGRYGEGESFGLQSLLTGMPVRFGITLIEDGLIWSMPRIAFDQLRGKSDEFDKFFLRSLEERLTSALQGRASSGQTLFMTPMGELVHRGPVSVGPETTIAECARQMANSGISSLLVRTEDGLKGIVTDRDLRNRVLAQDRDPSCPVSEIMTSGPLTLDASSPVVEGILAMAGRGIHHLPLTRGGEVVGMVTTRDLMSLQTQHPLYIAAQMQKQETVEGLAAICRRVPKLFELLLASGMRAEQVPKILSMISDTVTRQLVGFAEARLGPAPAPYAWLSFGSQAREEQSLKTDQDNGLVFADNAPADADDYFRELAGLVCDGLDACGYPYCPGEIMATTDSWRQPLSGWLRQFAHWAETPDPEAVLRVSIFFDLRHVCGTRSLSDRLSKALGDCGGGKGRGIFLATLARQAAEYDVPLGFFRRFVLESKGEHRETLDIKLNGLLPLTDLVRVRALKAGITLPSTQARLSELAESGEMSRSDTDRLAGAHRLLSGLRVHLHADQVRRGEDPHNHLDPKNISHAERAALRDTFRVIREAQRGLMVDFSL